MPSLSRARSGSQYEPQISLITFQPAPRNSPSSSWMILPLPRTGPSRRCRLQLTTKIRLSSFSREAMPIAPSDSGSSISPSPRNAHTLRSAVFGEAARVQVLQEARLVDRLDRPQPHRHGRELPEVGHQPRVRIRGDALAVDLAAEVERPLLGEAPLEECARVDARRGMALEEDQVAAVVGGRRVPEMVEARRRTASPSEAKLAMWPPRSPSALFARATITIAFQRSRSGCAPRAPPRPASAPRAAAGWC